MATTSFTVTHQRASDYRGTSSMTARNVVTRIIDFISGCTTGAYRATTVEVATGLVAASGTVTLSSASGDISITVGGQEVEVTASGGDAATAAALVAEMSDAGSPLVDWVTATSDGGVITITAKQPGFTGNAITLAVTGTGATASGTALSGGTSSTTSYTF